MTVGVFTCASVSWIFPLLAVNWAQRGHVNRKPGLSNQVKGLQEPCLRRFSAMCTLNQVSFKDFKNVCVSMAKDKKV